jgi:hypothetical protein
VLILSGAPDNSGLVGSSTAKNQRNNTGVINQTPKQAIMMMNRTEQHVPHQSADLHQHAAMQEKYAALLNKNLEDTSNLAKTLRNTKVHIYDKLRNSYQNAN